MGSTVQWGTMPGIRVLFAVVGLSLLVPRYAEGQARPLVEVRGEQWKINSGHLGSSEHLGGFSFLAGVQGTGLGGGFSLGHVPEGDVEPGWLVVQVEAGPRLSLHERVHLKARVRLGGLKMRVVNRHRVIETCSLENGCMFEAPAFEQGWSALGGGDLRAEVGILSRFVLFGRVGMSRLFSGANSGENLQSWGVGAQYRFR